MKHYIEVILYMFSHENGFKDKFINAKSHCLPHTALLLRAAAKLSQNEAADFVAALYENNKKYFDSLVDEETGEEQKVFGIAIKAADTSNIFKVVASILIFDLDGVICFTDDYHYLAWKSIADKENIYFDEIINNAVAYSIVRVEADVIDEVNISGSNVIGSLS